MSSGLDMSLDDLIKQSKTKPKGGAPSSSGPTRRAAPPAARAAPYPPAGPKAAGGASPYGVYSEHVAAMAGVVPRPRPPPAAAARSLETGTKLHISNLDPGVTVDDVQELFSEIGELKRYSVNYDKDGKSQGTAEVVFARKVDALEAIKRYDGVILDGNPMKIDLIGNNSETSPMPPTAPLLYNPPFPNYPNRLIVTMSGTSTCLVRAFTIHAATEISQISRSSGSSAAPPAISPPRSPPPLRPTARSALFHSTPPRLARSAPSAPSPPAIERRGRKVELDGVALVAALTRLQQQLDSSRFNVSAASLPHRRSCPQPCRRFDLLYGRTDRGGARERV
ncbi:hypothetical protein OsI_25456 [Oryza sativa Indica Group]|uniref:RRM domain-containing protein n=1 Tax=Oryza sativa subsp. indica TaxID=39946 RepID=B8B8J4_ORYSI|nr:hypothetical protein OsI_25456 [Oryza sativa Indica Group]